VRKRTGLRNRGRTGRSTYSKKAKGKLAERYDRPALDPDRMRRTQSLQDR
jgi:hypothetical protein